MVKNFRHLSEEELAALAKSGDEGAASELVTRLYFLVAYVAEQHSAIGIEKADLIQEGMLAVLGAIAGFRPERGVKFKTYAGRCVHHHFQTLARKVYRKKHIPPQKLISQQNFIQDEAFNPEELVIEKERLSEITSALKSKLSDFEFEILNKYLSGYSAAEIAASSGKSVKSISNALYRIRQKFHFILK